MSDLYEELLSNSIMTTTPQLGDDLGIGDIVFVNEDLELKNITLHTNLHGMQSYWTESNTIENVSIIDNSDVLIEFDDEVVFQSDFYVEQGSVLDVYNR